MSERDTFLTLHEADLRAAGETLAQQFHEMFSQQLDAGIIAALEDLGYEKDDDDLIVPSLKHHLHRSLMRKNASAAGGWLTIFFTNLAERYDTGGDV